MKILVYKQTMPSEPPTEPVAVLEFTSDLAPCAGEHVVSGNIDYKVLSVNHVVEGDKVSYLVLTVE